jgi:hypothetical protein
LEALEFEVSAGAVTGVDGVIGVGATSNLFLRRLRWRRP